MEHSKAETLYRPEQIDIEITTACNHSCRYCYNFWRHEDVKDVFMSRETLDTIIDDIVRIKATHIVLTGGEPFINYDVLLHGVKRLTEAGVNVSCNSNLTLATRGQLRELKEAGLPHILTSLASHDPEVNDDIFGKKGSYSKIIKNIITAVAEGIKVSVNDVITDQNVEDVYKTGIVAYFLGVSNFFVTGVVPGTPQGEVYRSALDLAIRVKDETGMNIGSLIQYPVCFLKDPSKYIDFIGRGCPAGKKMVCINADGETHACFHEEESYGNVLEIGIQGAWENMIAWRDGSLIPPICKVCSWFEWCEGGCRVAGDCGINNGLPSTKGYEKFTCKESWKKYDR